MYTQPQHNHNNTMAASSNTMMGSLITVVIEEEPQMISCDHGKMIVVALKMVKRTGKYVFQSQLAVAVFNTTATANLRRYLTSLKGGNRPLMIKRHGGALQQHEKTCNDSTWHRIAAASQKTKDAVDRSLKGRCYTMVPLDLVVRLLNHVGKKYHKYANAAVAWLTALGFPVVQALLKKRPTYEHVDEPDVQLADELETVEIAEETMLNEATVTFVPFVDVSTNDKKSSYAIKGTDYTATLDSQFKKYTAFRMQKINSKREGCAVVQSTVQSDISSTLRVLGYFKYKYTGDKDFDDQYDMRLYARPDFGDLMAEYVDFLHANERSWGTIANYLNSAMMVLQFVFKDKEDFQPSQRALYRMRNQSEKVAKQTKRYKDAHKEFITWEQAQEARIKAIEMWEDCEGSGSQEDAMRKAKKLRDALVIGFLTTQPPDRVGVIRKLKVYKTIRRVKGKWYIDLRDIGETHKTSRFYGPSVQEVSHLLTDMLNEWVEGDIGRKQFVSTESESERAKDSVARLYLFPNGNDARAMPSSNWTALVKAAFKRACGKSPPPSLLRASYITWLRSNAPEEVLKQAAIYMKHADDTQASRTYDLETYARQTKKAVAFTSAWVAKYEAKRAAKLQAKEASKHKASASQADDDSSSDSIISVDMADWQGSDDDNATAVEDLPRQSPKLLARVKCRVEKQFDKKKTKQHAVERKQRAEKRGVGHTQVAAVARFMNAYHARQRKKRNTARNAAKKRVPAAVGLQDEFEAVQHDSIKVGDLVIVKSNDSKEPIYMVETLEDPTGDELRTNCHWYAANNKGAWRPDEKNGQPWEQVMELKDTAIYWGAPHEVLDAKHEILPAVMAALKSNSACLLCRSVSSSSSSSSVTDAPSTSMKRKQSVSSHDDSDSNESSDDGPPKKKPERV